jgi:hypothetical protein
MRKILIIFVLVLLVTLVGSVVIFVTRTGKIPTSPKDLLVQTTQPKLDSHFDNLGIKFSYPSAYRVSMQSSQYGRQNTFSFISKDNSFRLMVISNRNDLSVQEIEKHGDWVKTSSAKLMFVLGQRLMDI